MSEAKLSSPAQPVRWSSAKVLWVSLLILLKLAIVLLLTEEQATRFVYAGF